VLNIQGNTVLKFVTSLCMFTQ